MTAVAVPEASVMRKRFEETIRGLFPEGGTVLLAVSGGMDSMCMASLFHSCPSAPAFAVANCNFHLRGEESDGDSAMVRTWCEERGIVCHMVDFQTDEYARSNHLSTEMAARELRYGWFDRLCRERGYSALCVAHNANDNAETLMLNLLRGSGIKGLTGMKAVSSVPIAGSEIPLVRPLLAFSRETIRSYVLSGSVPYRDDSSNFNSDYRRNVIRNEVFPILQRMNPSFLEAYSRDMANLSQVDAVADSYYELRRNALVSYEDAEHLNIRTDALMEEKNREYMLYRLLEPYGFTPSDLSSLNMLLCGSSTVSGRQFLAPRWRLVTGPSQLMVSRRRDLSPEDEVTVVRGPGIYNTGGVRYSVESCDAVPVEFCRVPGVTCADASVLAYPFIVRKWRKGDWMRPLGLGGRKKLSDMFVDLKMSLPEKEDALVVVAPLMQGNVPQDGPVRVAALMGKRIDEKVRVGEECTGVVILRIL